MGNRVALIGRDAERSALERGLARAAAGEGSIALLVGEAGVGKTRLAGEIAADADAITLAGGARLGATPAYGPLAAALRSHLRASPGALDDCGPLRPHLAAILPELGDAPIEGDPTAVSEAVRDLLAVIASAGTTLIVLDDLQWSDEATLDLIAALAPQLRELPIFVVVAYRSDEVGRNHPLRRLRAELRRAGALNEVELRGLELQATGELLGDLLGGPASELLTRAIHDRTQGTPFFVEELAAALVSADRLRNSDRGFTVAEAAALPVPDTIRDAVLLRASRLSEDGKAAAEVAAVAGDDLDLELLGRLAGEDGVAELVDRGFIVESEAGRAQFRHALVREAVYADVPWLRRRELHRGLAAELERAGASNVEIASHWVSARESVRARAALVRAVDELLKVHAYRDAARAGRQALELTESDDDAADRIGLLERYAKCSELTGELAEAVRAWREVIDLRQARDAGLGVAEAERRLASVYDREGDRKRSIEARLRAADAHSAAGALAEAAADRITAGGLLQVAARHAEAETLAILACADARAAERPDLEVEALGLQAVAAAKRGRLEEGRELAQGALSRALEQGMNREAASIYQRLGTVLETAADYEHAREVLGAAIALCDATDAAKTRGICLGCMAYVLKELGEWDRAADFAVQVIDDPKTRPGDRSVADGILGSVHGFRGQFERARSILLPALDVAKRFDVLSMQMDIAASLGVVEEAAGESSSAESHYRFLLERWGESEDRHYAVWGLRRAASHFAVIGDAGSTRSCAEALATIAADSGHLDARAALTSALGEAALLDGEADSAAEQLTRALDLHGDLDIPFERAHIALRAGVALAAAGEREPALDRFATCYRIARKLGARPLANNAAAEVTALGESIEERLGTRAASDQERGGLSRRELQVMRLVAVGRTNREIAAELVVSTRTVDMHVRNILTKLDCRSRVEAASRAGELGLLVAAER